MFYTTARRFKIHCNEFCSNWVIAGSSDEKSPVVNKFGEKIFRFWNRLTDLFQQIMPHWYWQMTETSKPEADSEFEFRENEIFEFNWNQRHASASKMIFNILAWNHLQFIKKYCAGQKLYHERMSSFETLVSALGVSPRLKNALPSFWSEKMELHEGRWQDIPFYRLKGDICWLMMAGHLPGFWNWGQKGESTKAESTWRRLHELFKMIESF